jgi:acetoin utilization deacetylase AcuC-like enzyme
MSLYINLEEKKLLSDLVQIPCTFADLNIIELVHSKEHIQKVLDSKFDPKKKTEDGEKMIRENRTSTYLAPDVFVNKYSGECALMSAGATINCVDRMYFSLDV